VRRGQKAVKRTPAREIERPFHINTGRVSHSGTYELGARDLHQVVDEVYVAGGIPEGAHVEFWTRRITWISAAMSLAVRAR